MTTEREFSEWPEKIRRVRGQAPLRKSAGIGRSRGSGLWWRLVLFLAGVAIALVLKNQMDSQRQPNSVPKFQYELRQ